MQRSHDSLNEINDPKLNEVEAATYLGVRQDTIRGYANSGRLSKHCEENGSLWFRQSELDQYRANKQSQAKSKQDTPPPIWLPSSEDSDHIKDGSEDVEADLFSLATSYTAKKACGKCVMGNEIDAWQIKVRKANSTEIYHVTRDSELTGPESLRKILMKEVKEEGHINLFLIAVSYVVGNAYEQTCTDGHEIRAWKIKVRTANGIEVYHTTYDPELIGPELFYRIQVQ